MKNIMRFKRVLIQSILSAFVFCSVVSCNDTPKVEDTKKVAEEHNDAKFEKTAAKDAEFLVNAAAVNLEEIKLGHLAQMNSKMAEVKGLGKMMEDDHTKSLSALTTLAQKKTVTLPDSVTNNGRDDFNNLVNLKGAKFDKAYCDMMVSGHKDAVTLFEKASLESTDVDIKQWATSMLPALRLHLDHSMTCQKDCEKMMK